MANPRSKSVAKVTGSPNGNWNGKRPRRVFCVAFVHSLEAAGVSVNAAARWMGKAPITVRGWIAGTHRIDFEAVYRSQKLWAPFFRCLVALERKARRV